MSSIHSIVHIVIAPKQYGTLCLTFLTSVGFISVIMSFPSLAVDIIKELDCDNVKILLVSSLQKP